MWGEAVFSSIHRWRPLTTPKPETMRWTPVARNLCRLITQVTIEGIYELVPPKLPLLKINTNHVTYLAVRAEWHCSHTNRLL